MAEIIESNHLTNGIDTLESDGNTSFLRAARNGQLEKVLEHLKTNIDINTSNANGLNALHLASKDGHVEIVDELLKRGAVVDAATKKGNTALHIASLAGQEEVVKLLVQHGASVNVQSQNGFTPLYMAAQENHDNVVKFLLANGANQSLSTEDGFTPLAVAMQQGHDKVVTVLLENDTRGKVRLPALHIAAKKDDVRAAKLLLENDHNPDVTSKSGFTPLHIASHYGNQSIANLLIQKNADVNYAAKHNITPLHVAAKWGKSNMVSLLLEQGAHIEAKTRDGLTPLHCAARSGHEQVVDMLLERSAPISSKTKNGLAPLHMAAQGDHVDAARILLYHRAPVDEVTVDYLTALHVAAHCGHVRVAKLLLDRQADANARALNGFTPLHIACKKNRIKVVELLLKHGACIGATTESGLTPLHVASFMGCMNIVIYLLQHDASPDIPTVRGETPLHLAARANQTDIIRILLRNGAQVDARAREQQTPLHIASRLGNVDIVMLLLQHGAMVDNTTKDLYTALHIAAKEGQDEVAAVLIENGASLNATTKKGFTPLHLAAKYGHLKVAKLLLQKEAPVDAQGKNGVTPLHVASHYDHQNVALLLLDKGASPHANAKNGHTPLHIAARKNQMDIAHTLLEYGAQPDAESKAGFTPLHLSSQEGHADISALLLEHKATPSHQSKNGLTPMHLCAQENKVAVAEILYKNGAEIDASTKGGYTPLHIASHYGQTDMVKFLLSKGADVKAKTSIGYTPLHQAAQQGHTNIVNLLLENAAQPNALTNNGQTPLHIAQKLGYITVIDTLKEVTDNSNVEAHSEEKYRVVAPEAMHETFLSDSEEEGEDTLLGDQTYRYLTADEMKSLGDDSLPIDVTRDERIDSNRMVGSDDPNAYPPRHIEDSISPERIHPNFVEYIKKTPDNIDISRHPVNIGFLVSFLVDARGGAMRGCRHSGVRVIVPPRCAPSPTRITCRYVRPQRTPHPPPLMEGEALASRVLELGPVGAKFLGPVIIEVPHFAALRGKEREIVILRSDNGESWKEHTIEATEDVLNDILKDSFDSDDLNQLEDASSGRITRIVTQDFPQYFAVISRIRQEVHAIGPEGGMVSSTVVPQVQAVFPQGALTKKIKVGLQAQPIDPELTAKLLGHGVAVSPVVTVEPRRRKFHKAITLSMPAPRAHSQGMINQYSGSAPTLRLLCSITGGTTRAQWEDVTGSTPLTFVNDCVSFTTTVSARFWLMDCRNVGDATKMATELYREAIHVPFIAKFAVFAKRIDPMEARLRVFCMTDDKEEKTLEYQEQFTEIAKSRDVEVLEGKSQYIEFAGNLVPITKSGEQLQFSFRAFKENRLPFSVRVKDQHAEAVSRCLFMREPKVQKGEPPQQPICILNIVLPDDIVSETISLTDSESLRQKYYANENFDYYRQDPRLADISNLLGEDWVQLANQLDLTSSEINVIKSEYPDSVAKQAQCMLRMWLSQSGNRAQTNTLENALRRLGREDIVKQCLNIDNRSQQILKLRLEEKGKHRLREEVSGEDITKQKKYSVKSERAYETEPEIIDKYSAEEKTFEPSDEEEDFNKTVPERREQIVKRLSNERTIPASSQRVEIVQEISSIKRQSLVEDKIAEVKQKANIEPMKLTTIKPVSKILQEKKILSETIETKTTDQNEIVSEKVSNAQDIDLTITDLPVQKAKDKGESVLFEEVTQRLESRKPISKLITGEDPKSPNVSKTPPPSPADFALKEKQATTTQEWHAAEEDPISESKQHFTANEELEGKTTPNLCKLEEKLLDTHKTVDPPSVAFPNIENVELLNFKNILNETNAFIQSESKGEPHYAQREHESAISDSERQKDKKSKKGILGSLKSFVRKSSAKQEDDGVMDLVHEPSTPRKARLPTPPPIEDKQPAVNQSILETDTFKIEDAQKDIKPESSAMIAKEVVSSTVTEHVLEVEPTRSNSPDNDKQIGDITISTDSGKSEIIEKQDKEFSKESPKHGDKRKRSGILGFFSRKSKKSSEDTNDEITQQLSDEHSKRIISTNSFLTNEKTHYEDSFHHILEPKKGEKLDHSNPSKLGTESTYIKFDGNDVDYEPIDFQEPINTLKQKKVKFDIMQVEPHRDASPPEKVICQLTTDSSDVQFGKVETTESGSGVVEETVIVVSDNRVPEVEPSGKTISSTEEKDQTKMKEEISHVIPFEAEKEKESENMRSNSSHQITSTEFLENEKLKYEHPVSVTFNKKEYEKLTMLEKAPQEKTNSRESDIETGSKESKGGIFRIFNRKSEDRQIPAKVTSIIEKTEEKKLEEISPSRHIKDVDNKETFKSDTTEVKTSYSHEKIMEFTEKFLSTETECISEVENKENFIDEHLSGKTKTPKSKGFFKIFKRKSQEKESPKKKIPTLDAKNEKLDDWRCEITEDKKTSEDFESSAKPPGRREEKIVLAVDDSSTFENTPSQTNEFKSEKATEEKRVHEDIEDQKTGNKYIPQLNDKLETTQPHSEEQKPSKKEDLNPQKESITTGVTQNAENSIPKKDLTSEGTSVPSIELAQKSTKEAMQATQDFLHLEHEFYHDTERETADVDKDDISTFISVDGSPSMKDRKTSKRKGIFQIFKRKSGDKELSEGSDITKTHDETRQTSSNEKGNEINGQGILIAATETEHDANPMTQQFLVKEHTAFVQEPKTSEKVSADMEKFASKHPEEPSLRTGLKSEEETLQISEMKSSVESSNENKDGMPIEEAIKSTESFLDSENRFYHDVEKPGEDIDRSGEVKKDVSSGSRDTLLSKEEKKSSKTKGIFKIFNRKSGEKKNIDTIDTEGDLKSNVEKSVTIEKSLPLISVDSQKNVEVVPDIAGPEAEHVHDLKQITHDFLKDEKTLYDHGSQSSKEFLFDTQVLLSGVEQLQENVESSEKKLTQTEFESFADVNFEGKEMARTKTYEDSIEKTSTKALMQATENFLHLENMSYDDVEKRTDTDEQVDISTSSPNDVLLSMKDKKSSKTKGIFHIFNKKSGGEMNDAETASKSQNEKSDPLSEKVAGQGAEIVDFTRVTHEFLKDEKTYYDNELAPSKQIVSANQVPLSENVIQVEKNEKSSEARITHKKSESIEEIDSKFTDISGKSSVLENGDKTSMEELVRATVNFLNLENEFYHDAERTAAVHQDTIPKPIPADITLSSKDKKSPKHKGIFDIFKRKSKDEKENHEADSKSSAETSAPLSEKPLGISDAKANFEQPSKQIILDDEVKKISQVEQSKKSLETKISHSVSESPEKLDSKRTKPSGDTSIKDSIQATNDFLDLENEFYHDVERTATLHQNDIPTSIPQDVPLSSKDKKNSKHKGIFSIFKRKSAGEMEDDKMNTKSRPEITAPFNEQPSQGIKDVDGKLEGSPEISGRRAGTADDFSKVTHTFLKDERILFDHELQPSEQNILDDQVHMSEKVLQLQQSTEPLGMKMTNCKSESVGKLDSKSTKISEETAIVEKVNDASMKELIQATDNFLSLENEFYQDVERTATIQQDDIATPISLDISLSSRDKKHKNIFSIFKKKPVGEINEEKAELKSSLEKSAPLFEEPSQGLADSKQEMKVPQEILGQEAPAIKNITHDFLKGEKTSYDHETSSHPVQLQQNKETSERVMISSKPESIQEVEISMESTTNKKSMEELMHATGSSLGKDNEVHHDAEKETRIIPQDQSPQEASLSTKDKKSSKSKGIFNIFKRKSADPKLTDSSTTKEPVEERKAPAGELAQYIAVNEQNVEDSERSVAKVEYDSQLIQHEISVKEKKPSSESKPSKEIVDGINRDETSMKDAMQATQRFLHLENELYQDAEKEPKLANQADSLKSAVIPTKEKKTKTILQIFQKKSDDIKHSETDELEANLHETAGFQTEDSSRLIENLDTKLPVEEKIFETKKITHEFLEDARISYGHGQKTIHDSPVLSLERSEQFQPSREYVEKTSTDNELEQGHRTTIIYREIATDLQDQKIKSFSETTSKRIVNINMNQENGDAILDQLSGNNSLQMEIQDSETKFETEQQQMKEIITDNLGNDREFSTTEKENGCEGISKELKEAVSPELVDKVVVETTETKPFGSEKQDQKSTGGLFQIFGKNVSRKTDESENEKKGPVVTCEKQTKIPLIEGQTKKAGNGLDENQPEKKTKSVFKIFGRKDKKKSDELPVSLSTKEFAFVSKECLGTENVSDSNKKTIESSPTHGTEKTEISPPEVIDEITRDIQGEDLANLHIQQMSPDQIVVQTEYEKSGIEDKVEQVSASGELISPTPPSKEIKQVTKKKKQKSRTKSLTDGEESEIGNRILNFFTRRSKSKDREEILRENDNRITAEVLKNIDQCKSFLDTEIEFYEDVKLFDETLISLSDKNIPETVPKKDLAIEKPVKKPGIFKFLKRKIKNENKQITNTTEMNESFDSNLIDSAQFIRTEIDNFEDVRPQSIKKESNTQQTDVDVFETTTEVDNVNIIDLPEFTAFDFIKEEIQHFENTKMPFTDTIDASFRVDTEVENIEGDSPKEIIRKKIIITEKLIEKPTGQAGEGKGVSVQLVEKLGDVQEELRNRMAPNYSQQEKQDVSRKSEMDMVSTVTAKKSEMLQPKSGSQEHIENVETEYTERIEDLKMAKGDVIEDVSVLESKLDIIPDNTPERITDLDENLPETPTRESSGIFQRMKINENVYQHHHSPPNVEKTKLKQEDSPLERGVSLKNSETGYGSVFKCVEITASAEHEDESINSPLVTSPTITRGTMSCNDLNSDGPVIVSVSSDSSENMVESPSDTTARRRPLFRLESEDEEIATNSKMDKKTIIETVENYKMDTSDDGQVEKISIERIVREAQGTFMPEDFNPATASKSDVDIIEEKLRDLGKALDSLEILNEIKDDKREKKLKRVERKFERMASEIIEQATATEQADKSPNIAENKQYQQLVSQLSTDEVMSFQNDYSTLWDEYTFSKSDEWDSKTPDSQADILELPQGDTTAESPLSHDPSALKDEPQASSSDKQEGQTRSQPFDQHQLSDEMKELLKEMEKTNIQ